MSHRVLINVPDLSIIGGKANYYSALKGRFQGNVQYFTYGSRGNAGKEGKLGFVFRMLSDYFQFMVVLNKEKITLVHLNPSLEFKGFFRDAVFFFIAHSLFRKKVIVFWRGWSKEFESTVGSKYMWLMRLTFLKANTKIVLAKEFETQLRNWGYQGQIFLETTVLDEFLIDNYSPQDISEKFKSTEVKLLFLARLERNKGIFEILEVFKRIKNDYPDLRLSIAGDGGAMNEVKEVIKARELSDVDIHGFVSGESKRQVLRDAHVYLFPSWHGEGLPNSLLEAMGCGMPILTTANAGIKDFFQQPEMGFILKDCSSDELETRLIDLLKDREMQLKMALFNYSYAKEHFAANKVVDRLEQIYSKV